MLVDHRVSQENSITYMTLLPYLQGLHYVAKLDCIRSNSLNKATQSISCSCEHFVIGAKLFPDLLFLLILS
jgi:hypothetical protein